MPNTNASAVRRLLVELGITPEELATLAGVKDITIYTAQDGGYLSKQSISKIARAISKRLDYKVSPSELIDHTSKMQLINNASDWLDFSTRVDKIAFASQGENTHTLANAPTPISFPINRIVSIDRPPPPTVPAQTRSAHFTIEGGMVEAIPTQKIAEDKNDYRRLAALHIPLLEAAIAAEQELSNGNKPFGFLLESVSKYRSLIDKDVNDINYAALFAYGAKLEIALKRTQEAAAKGDLPEFPVSAITTVESLCQLHGPFILSSGDGRDLIIDAERYNRSPDEERQFQEDVRQFGEELANRKDIVEPQTVDFIKDITQKDDGSANFERNYVFTKGAAKNLIIVLSAGAIIASASFIPAVGPYIAASLGLVGVEALKKSEVFQDLVEPVRNSLNNIKAQRFDNIAKVPASQLEKIRDFVISNKDLMRRVGGRSGEMSWFREVLHWIDDEKQDQTVIKIPHGSGVANIISAPQNETTQSGTVERLTLGFLKGLPRGTYIVSNVLNGGRPAFAATIGDEEPNDLYQRIKEQSLQGRMFRYYPNKYVYDMLQRLDEMDSSHE